MKLINILRKCWSYLKEKINKNKCDWFVYIYDVISRGFKSIGFVLIVLLLIIYWKDIDILGTTRKMVAKYAEFRTIDNRIAFTSTIDSTQEPATESDKNVYQNGSLVFITDKVYNLTPENCFIDKMFVQSTPNYQGEFLYNKTKIKITNIQGYIEMLFTKGGFEGPLVQGVKCEIINN